MRLLRHSDTGEFSLTKDLVGDEANPPYAILSHTWGADADEVTFKDLTNGTGKDKPGYEKIRFCGEQARRDDLQYFWIDTCCIDKTNKAELSQAINSMFRWYRNATRCYVYLSDVSIPPFNTNDEFNSEPWESNFRKSRWFTRGWTLQELLAPYSVEFFSRERKRLGDKRLLTQQIHEITGIPNSALQGTPLSLFSINERLLWIERRYTKLEEDRAYSVLGIFNVYISPLYGEGAGGAFRRLLDEIHKLDKCIQDIRLTDPRDDKKRIEDIKGGLLEGSYRWVLGNASFQQWHEDPRSRLLWINGDPGKGKTMLLCGIIDELEKSIAKSNNLSYFFCQATDPRINNATAVLRGLLYLLVNQQPSLAQHLRKKYDQAGQSLFQDANAWVALSDIFTNMIRDPDMKMTCLVVDALDECVADLPKLLDLVIYTSASSARVKWLLSSRNEVRIERKLRCVDAKARLSLELNQNAEQVSRAVNVYIDDKLSRLKSLKDNSLRDQVRDILRQKADGTFLWVALVVQELEGPEVWDQVVLEAPPGLHQLYDRMMYQIQQLRGRNSEICWLLLSTACVAYRPLYLAEIGSLCRLSGQVSVFARNVRKIVGMCGSFLNVRDDQVYFIHQSAKVYLSEQMRDIVFSSRRGIHYDMFSRSLKLMSSALKRDMYSLIAPGFPVDKVQVPVHDPLATIRYSCVHWVDHLCDWNSNSTNHGIDFQDKDAIENFIRKKYLYWLEALGLLRNVSRGISSMAKLDGLLQERIETSWLIDLVRDARRFILYHKWAIETTPLQVYALALVFNPAPGITRDLFKQEEPTWFASKPAIENDQNKCLHTLKGHSSWVHSVIFSHDSKQIASASHDCTVKIWDTATGQCLQTLKGHRDWVSSVAFSHDSKQVASASDDCTVKIWDTATGQCLQTLRGHRDWVSSVAFSHDSKYIASASYDRTVKAWDVTTGKCLQTLEGHSESVMSVAFSHDSKQAASASYDRTAKIWDVATGKCLQTLKGHRDWVSSVAFSHDSKQAASASFDRTVKTWDVTTGKCLQTLEGHNESVYLAAFSQNSKQIASASGERTVRIWDVTTGQCLQTLKGHSEPVISVAFSPDSKIFASGLTNGTVRLWDADREVWRQALVDDTRIENEEREVANSDSGYASGTYGPSNTSYTFAESKLVGIAEASESEEQIGLGCRADAADPPNMGLYDKDTAYSPSETPSLPPFRSKIYIDDLASQLFRTVASQKPDQETLNRVSRELPDLLRAFSLKIGYRATPTQCHVAYFLHKYRKHVQQSFENMFPLESVSSKADVPDSPDTEGYKIAHFFEGLDLAVDPPQEEDSEYQDLPPAAADRASLAGSDHNGDTEDDVEPPEPIPYRDSVLNSPAFDWLVTTLLTEVNLTRQTAGVMRSIRNQILGTLPSSHEVSRKTSSREYRARFEIDWDPLSFVKDQKYRESPDQAIERSITITGSPEDAQALTTGQYLAQTWPASGAKVMRLVAEAMRNTDHHASGTLPDGTELQTRIDGGKFTVHATGVGDSLAEVAQQFAWLGAALRSSPYESGITMCSPAIRNPSLENITPQATASDSEPFAEISCVIEFDIQEPLSGAQRGAGHCWHSMFRNPVMVKGYPIMAKHKSGLGLEMPLNIMSRLAGSKYANEFDGKTFIKGFSAMLIATEVSQDLLLWHYYFNVTGERISYLDHDLEIVEAISLQQLGAARHVVGWCCECDSYAGAGNVAYGDIGSVYLPEPHPDCILEKISISGGKLISGGVSFAVGVHHIPPHLTRDSYLGKLTWIATRFVVFWDERDKRGWLVNGTSALLHLVRASIQHHSSGDFSALVTFDPGKIKYPAELKPNSASRVLSNPENLGVEVQLDKVEKIDEEEPEKDGNGDSTSINWKPKFKRTYKLFCDVVEEHYRHLEQTMDYQVQAGGQSGVKIKLRVRKHLEGWDFMELATGHDPSPRVATLEALGWGWVDFVRSIEAITLIGSGFGEMIHPTEFDGMCPNWKNLPARKYYLAATVFDLENVIKTKKFGGSLEQPIKAVRDLLWHSPQETVAPCPCHSGPGPQGYLAGSRHHHDPVQVFYPTALKPILPIKGPDKLHSAGAVVFGHNFSWRLRWKEKGEEHVEQGEPPPSLIVTYELDATTASAQSRASSDAAPAQVASPSSQSHESSSGVTRYSSASTSAIVSTPIESAIDSAAPTASTSSEIGPRTLTSVAQIPLDSTPSGGIQKTSLCEKGSNLFQKMKQKLNKSK